MLVSLIVGGAAIYLGALVAQALADPSPAHDGPLPEGAAPGSPDEAAAQSLRDQQLAELSTEAELARRGELEAALDQEIQLAGVATGLATAGFWVPPLALLSAPICVYLDVPIYKRSWASLKERKITTDTMVSVLMIGGMAGGYFFAISVATLLYTMSFKLLMKVTDQSKDRLVDAFRGLPDFAWIIADEVELRVPVAQLERGQLVIVRGGEVIPADGVIEGGLGRIDESQLTGESQLQDKGPGDLVFASTVAQSGVLRVRVESAGRETTVAKLGQILNDTVDFKANAQLRAERLSNQTILPTLAASAIALPFLGPSAALAVLNAHTKDRINIIAPIGIMRFLDVASTRGVLIKDGRSLDLLNTVDTIVFDKTGTLTEEQPTVGEIVPAGQRGVEDVLRYAAAAEQRQDHPIARAILAAAGALELPPLDEATYQVGFGLTSVVGQERVRVGSPRFMELEGLATPDALSRAIARCRALGRSMVLVAVEREVIGGIELLPSIRPEAKAVVKRLRENPRIREIIILSGDHEAPTRALADELGIETFFAEVLPSDKADVIARLQEEGRSICYIGDGVNDSIALKRSQVSVSLRGASTIATDTAQVILLDGDLSQLNFLFSLSRDFHRNTNATFAAVVVPAAMGIAGVLFLHFGFLHTVVLNLAGLGAGVANASRPRIEGS